ncbi:hypothetical protein GCM10010420_21160 [Streptomyces glaucosporus]|uniref:Uncharacterized protein n=1 Tax=Streptomyces glaucosporus TaxID=284044 RepID=A0ABN3I5L6_9ACTN
MGSDGDLGLSRHALDQITSGLRAAIGELKDVGNSTGALQGSGFAEMSLTKMEAGGGRLADAFEGFCERWEWGVRALVQDANGLAARLGLAAGMLWEEEQYWKGTFKIGLNSLVGNPHATEDEVVGQGVRDILTPDAPDYSAESFRQAGQEAGQVWKDTGRSLATEGFGGFQANLMNQAAGIDDQTFERGLDEAFGPSPEERAQQAGQGGS